jgi:colanic acid biosynthesis protein WcaH
MSFLEKEQFSSIIKNTPLVSLDLVVRNNKNEILLGKRTNKPAKGYWFVPGGRIRKDESLDNAFTRLTETELGMAIERKTARFIGPYEHFYQDNTFNDQFSTHYVVLGYEVHMDEIINDLPNDQHEQYRWITETDLLQADDVHIHTKWYFSR